MLLACVRTGFVRVSKFWRDTKEGRIWYCRSWTFCSGVRPLRAPALRLENPPLVGAKMVKLLEELSWFSIWLTAWVFSRRRMKTLKPPALSRISVTFGGAGFGAFRGGAWTRGSWDGA